MKIKREMRLGLALLLVVSLVASACAPAVAPTPTPTAPTKVAEPTKPPAAAATKAPEPAKPAGEAAKPPAAKPPIKIGYITSLTGPFAANGTDMKDGFALYLSEKDNVLAGRKIELIVEDDETNPQVGLTKAKKLVERDGVQMVAGIISSAVAYAVYDYAKSQKIPLFIHNAGADDLTKARFSPYIFRNSFANSQVAYPAGEWAYKKGYRKAAILASDMAAGLEASGGFARTFTEAGGKIVYEQYPPLGTPDPAPFVVGVPKDIDLLYVWQMGSDAPRFFKAWEDYGFKGKIPTLGSTAQTSEEYFQAAGDSILGAMSLALWTTELDTPGNKAFMAAWQKKYNRQVAYGPALAYEGAMLLEKGLQAVNGNIEDMDGFIKALEKAEIADGPRGPVKFDEYHNASPNYYLVEVKKVGGKLVNSIVETVKPVSQFWKWTPQAYMQMPPYTELKGKWVK